MDLYKREGSAVWYMDLNVPGHPRIRRSTGETDRVKAQRVYDETKAGLWKQPRLKGYTWGKAVMLWAEQPGRGEPDLLAMAKFGRIYKDRVLADVTAENITAALDFCKTPGTWMRYRNRITAILNLAKSHGWVREVPELPTKRVPKSPRNWLTPEEWGRLFVRLPPHQRQMALFALETGLRQANVLGLRWNQVDLERRLVWYEANNMKGRRALSVPLSDRAYELLASLQNTKKSNDVFVFAYRGRPITEVKTAFKRACADAGIDNFTWHGLRHTWATWHVQNGTPLGVLQQLGGWADLDMVMHYAHHSANYVAEYANNNRKRRTT